MSVAEAFEKVVYEYECSFNATVTYEDRAVDGLIALRIINVITPEEAMNILHKVQIKTIDTITTIANNISSLLEDMKESDMTPEELSSLLIRIVALLTDMSTHKIEDTDIHVLTSD